MPLRRTLTRTAFAGVVVLGLAQLVPYGWWHDNPPVVQDTPWPSDDARRIARTSCYSCHSNETEWPVYSYVAPMSWLVRSDVEGGRAELNFSDWDEAEGELDDAVEMIDRGEMPLGTYTLVHRDAALTDAETETLIAALRQLDESGAGDDDGGKDTDNSGRGNGEDRDGRRDDGG